VQVALLHAELFLLLDQLAQILEIDDLRPGLPLHQVFADADPLLEDRDHRLDLGDRCGIGPELGPALCPLLIEGGELGALLAGLVEQQFALGRQQPHRRAVGRIKGGERIAIGERRVQSRDVELCGDEVALQMAQFGVVDCRVELDQHVACLDRLPVADMDGANDRGLERLHILLRPLGMILPCAEATVSTLPRLAQASAAQNAAITVSAMARPIGEGGVSTISSAAGRNAMPSAGRNRRAPGRAATRDLGISKHPGHCARRRITPTLTRPHRGGGNANFLPLDGGGIGRW